MTVPLLDLRVQFESIQDEVMRRLMATVETQRFILGEAVEELEHKIAALCGTDHAVACASGTDALLLSLKALIRPGDEVVTTPFTFFATAGAVVNAGGIPVFVDIEPDTFNIDPAGVDAAITHRTRAVIPVHLFGQMAAMERLLPLAEASGLTVVEDAAQAIGARRRMAGKWEHAGALGTTGAFSFFPSKNLGGWGDGGMIVTRDGDLADRLRRLRTHGGAKQYHHDEVGTNSRLDAIQAAVLNAKFPHLPEWNDARRRHAAFYTEALANCPGVTPPPVDPANEHVFHQYTIRVSGRDDVMAALKADGIGCAVYYPTPLHLQPCFASLGYAEGRFPEAERASREVLSLPVYPELTPESRDRVVEAVQRAVS